MQDPCAKNFVRCVSAHEHARTMKHFAMISLLGLSAAAGNILPLLEASGAASGSVVVSGQFSASSIGAVLQPRGAHLEPAEQLGYKYVAVDVRHFQHTSIFGC